MSNVSTLEAPIWGLEAPEASSKVVNAIGANACITLGEEITFADLIGGKVAFTAESIIFDRSGVQIDAAELLSHVETELLPARNI